MCMYIHEAYEHSKFNIKETNMIITSLDVFVLFGHKKATQTQGLCS